MPTPKTTPTKTTKPKTATTRSTTAKKPKRPTLKAKSNADIHVMLGGVPEIEPIDCPVNEMDALPINTSETQKASVIDAEVVSDGDGHQPPVTPSLPVHPDVPVPSSALVLQSPLSAVSDTISTADAITVTQHDEQLEVAKGQRGQGIAITHYEEMAILDLYHRKKLKQTEIATRLNCNQGTVSRTITKYAGTAVLAKKKLAAGALRLVDTLLETENPKMMTAVAGVLKGIRTDDGGRVLEPDKEPAASGGAAPVNPIYIGLKVDID